MMHSRLVFKAQCRMSQHFEPVHLIRFPPRPRPYNSSLGVSRSQFTVRSKLMSLVPTQMTKKLQILCCSSASFSLSILGFCALSDHNLASVALDSKSSCVSNWLCSSRRHTGMDCVALYLMLRLMTLSKMATVGLRAKRLRQFRLQAKWPSNHHSPMS